MTQSAGQGAPTTGAIAPQETPRPEPPGGITRLLPGLHTLANYRVAWLPNDLVAGLVLTAVLVPVGMGYATAAGLQPIYGLYATMAPLLAYALFGPSRILVLGPDSALAGVIAATVIPLSAGDPALAATLAAAIAIIGGALCILAGVARLGFVTDLLSKPIRYGYVNGIALTVFVGQLPKLFGFSTSADTFLAEISAFVQGVLSGKTNPVALAIGLAGLAIILAFKRWLPKIPGVLVAVVLATAVTAALNLAQVAGVPVVGPLPQGLPSFKIPVVSPSLLGPLVVSAFVAALVAFADTTVLSRIFAMRGGYRVSQNQELIALGAANAASGFFQGFSISSSASRTPVAESAGSKTQLTGVIGAICIALMLIFLPNLLANLPSSALAAVVITASIALVEVPDLLRLYRLRRSEFYLSLVCFLGVALFGVIYGVFVSIGIALVNFIWRAWRPHYAVLGRVQGVKGYHDVTRHPDAKRIPGLVLFRWDAPLFFANAEAFSDGVLQAIEDAPTPTRWIVVAAEPVTDVDVTAADVLDELDHELGKAGIELCFAEMKGPVKDNLKRYGLFTQVGADRFFATLGQAVDGYLAETKLQWVDWEESTTPEEWGAR